MHELDPRHNPFDFNKEARAAPPWIKDLIESHESLPWQRRDYLRGAMLDKLRTTPALAAALRFTRLFYGSPSTYLWTDAAGTTHQVRQGEGGEQGDPLMPAFYPLGQHDGFRAGAAQLHADDFVVAYLDDLYVKTTKGRAYAAFTAVSQAVEHHAGVATSYGKLRAWCRGGGPAPPDLLTLPDGEEIWIADLPDERNGVTILGTPLGAPAFVAAHANNRLEEEKRLLDHLPELPDLSAPGCSSTSPPRHELNAPSASCRRATSPGTRPSATKRCGAPFARCSAWTRRTSRPQRRAR